jgi:hypothetical protein
LYGTGGMLQQGDGSSNLPAGVPALIFLHSHAAFSHSGSSSLASALYCTRGFFQFLAT